jgi:isocitrate dehydrogenase
VTELSGVRSETVGPDQKWLSTMGFLDKVDENLNKALAG